MWKKLGRLSDGSTVAPPWGLSHAALPVVESIGDGRHRVFFSARDAQGRARIGSADVDLDAASGWRVAPGPVVDLGPLGGFDDNGVTSSCLVAHGGRKFLFYTGWSLGVTVPFYLSIGLAIGDEDSGYQRVSKAPLFDRDGVDPFLTASPWVLIEGDVWRMWYVSGTCWVTKNGRATHRYHIRYAESPDGLQWQRRGVVCIDFKSEDEFAIARPCVIKDRDLYRMWYSYRGNTYRIGYAESLDGISWRRRDDEAGIDVSADGWDAEMIEYPCIVDLGTRRLMLYNGDGYGRTGIGIAEWQHGTTR
jgi:hypothetical protein